VAHCRDGGRPTWRPLIGVVLPPLWHQGHKGMPRTGARGNYPRTAAEGLRLRWPHGPVGRAGVVGASEMATGVVVGSAVIPVCAARSSPSRGLTQHLASPRAHPKPGPTPQTRGNASWASAVAPRVVWCRSPRPRFDDGPGRRLSGAPVPEVGLGGDPGDGKGRLQERRLQVQRKSDARRWASSSS
jgi:hypothetical protein